MVFALSQYCSSPKTLRTVGWHPKRSGFCTRELCFSVSQTVIALDNWEFRSEVLVILLQSWRKLDLGLVFKCCSSGTLVLNHGGPRISVLLSQLQWDTETSRTESAERRTCSVRVYRSNLHPHNHCSIFRKNPRHGESLHSTRGWLYRKSKGMAHSVFHTEGNAAIVTWCTCLKDIVLSETKKKSTE